MNSVGWLIIDGTQVTTNDRILIKDQTNQNENGIYYVSNQGGATAATLTRSIDYDGSRYSQEIKYGDFIYVTAGSTLSKTIWTQDYNVTNVGSDPMSFTLFMQNAQFTSGNGISVVGNTINLVSPVVVSNGGTGLTSVPNNYIVYGSGTDTMNMLADPVNPSVLICQAGSNPPQWSNGPLPIAYGGTGSVASSFSNNTLVKIGPTGIMESITTQSNSVLTTSGTTIQWSASLPVTSGGTGLTSINANAMLYASASNTISTINSVTNGVL